MHDLVKHHRKTLFIQSEDNSAINVSLVPRAKLRAWKTLFGEMSTAEIVDTLNDVYIDPDYRIIAVRSNHLHIPIS